MFRDSTELVDFVWYPADQNAEVLPFPSAFLDPVWDEWPWEISGLGVQWKPKIRENWQRTRPLTGRGHFCGTADDFANGGVYDPNPPFVTYQPNLLPDCCLFPEQHVDGGAAVGGHVVPTYTPPPPPFVPGNTCATAAIANVDQYYTFPSSSALAQWIVLNRLPGAGGFYLLLYNDEGLFGPVGAELLGGSSCAGLVPYGSYLGGFVYTFALASTDVGYFALSNPGPGGVPIHFAVTTTEPIWTGYPHGGAAVGGHVVPTYTP